MLAEVYGWFTEGFDTADLKEAELLLGSQSQSLVCWARAPYCKSFGLTAYAAFNSREFLAGVRVADQTHLPL